MVGNVGISVDGTVGVSVFGRMVVVSVLGVFVGSVGRSVVGNIVETVETGWGAELGVFEVVVGFSVHFAFLSVFTFEPI